MSGLRALIGDWGGAGSLVGTALLVGVGAAMVASHAGAFREAVREKPFVRTCQAFLESPRAAGWVSVNGCSPDAEAHADLGERARLPGGVHLLPLRSTAGEPPSPARVLLQTTDEALVASTVDGGAPQVKTLTGMVVEPEAGATLRLVEGETPARVRPIAVVLLGMALMTWAFVPLVRRIQAYRLR